MRKTSDLNEVLQDLIGEGARHGVMHATLDDAPLNGRVVPLDGCELVNFASCSYMGLETDPRLIEGAVAAVRRYGTQLSSSRLFLSAAPYTELEERLSVLSGGHALVTPTTSLGHLAALPVLVEEADAVLYDQRLHHSVQTVLRLLPGAGVPTEIVKHNRLDLLEARLAALRHTHRRVWYVADGIYSIFGDRAPVAAIKDLLDRYEQLHVYFDDAHGTGWCGPSGRGHVLEALAGHPRVVTALSLNKSFAAAGGCLVFPTAAMRDKVRACGAPMNFSGPVQPPMLGAALASAALHLAPDWADRQAELAGLIAHAHERLSAGPLPLASPGESPILFVGMGVPRAAHLMGERLREEGYFVTAATFPGVPIRQSGMRLSLTRHLTAADIDGVAAAMERHLPDVLAETGTTLEAVREAFDLPAPVPTGPRLTGPIQLRVSTEPPPRADGLVLTHATSIAELDGAEWDRLLGTEGTFSAAGLALLEAVYGEAPGRASAEAQTRVEDRWKFHYYVVRDAAGAPVLATFFTDALWKDDMIARKEVSAAVEAERARRHDPYHLTTRTFGMGSLLTDGRHLWMDREGPWQAALDMVLVAADAERRAGGANVLALRDFTPGDAPLETFLKARGYVRFPMPEVATVTLTGPNATEEGLLAGLSQRSRKVYREAVVANAAAYTFEIRGADQGPLAPAEIAHLHGLYRNVKARNLGFNTFELPEAFFAEAIGREPWELVLVRLAPEAGGPADGSPVGFALAYRGETVYTPHVMGMDYGFVESHGLYRSMLWWFVRRARALGASEVFMGFGALLEKQRVGARVVPQVAYFQAKDHDNLDELIRLMETVPG